MDARELGRVLVAEWPASVGAVTEIDRLVSGDGRVQVRMAVAEVCSGLASLATAG